MWIRWIRIRIRNPAGKLAYTVVLRTVSYRRLSPKFQHSLISLSAVAQDIYLGDANLDPEILHLGRREESLHSGDNGSLCARQNDRLTKLQPSIHLNKSNENKSTYSNYHQVSKYLKQF
jgi:hypothetical protein